MNRSKVIITMRILGVLLLVISLFGALIYFSKPSSFVEKMDVIFVKTKDDADCTILLNRNKTIMIDTGEIQDFEHIEEILNQYNVEKIDCLILTHPDKDHIGSALKIIENYSVGLVVESYFAKENERFEELNQYIEDQRLNRLVLSRNRTFVYGDIHLTVYPPNEYEYSNDNNYSLAVKVNHQDISMFFAGDAIKKRTAELLSLNLSAVDLYKASYHGRDYEGAEELLIMLNPKEVVITAETVGIDLNKQIEKTKSNVYFTLDEELHFISDGKILKKV